jgi:hypothetical protein
MRVFEIDANGLTWVKSADNEGVNGNAEFIALAVMGRECRPWRTAVGVLPHRRRGAHTLLTRYRMPTSTNSPGWPPTPGCGPPSAKMQIAVLAACVTRMEQSNRLRKAIFVACRGHFWLMT